MKSSILLPFIATSLTQAAVTITLPGNSESAQWTNLKNAPPYTGAGGASSFFNASAAWPTPIPGNTSATSSAVFSKISGGGYFATSSVYDAGVAGIYSLSDSTPISNLATLVFQIDAGTAIGVLPTLNFNGGSQALAADFFLSMPGNYTANGPDGPVPTTNRAWQWDLSSISDITSYEIRWGSTTNNHLTQNQINITAGDAFTQVIPEPSTMLLSAFALSTIILRRKK